jgi:uncharacterized protein YegL
MKKGKSEVIIVLDRSGSMSKIKSDVEGGFKTFIDKQKKEPGECLVSLYQFDDKYETVYEARDINSVSELTLVPRGNTALLDAMGRTIDAVGARLACTRENDRPESVIILIMTDGEENWSTEYTKNTIKEMIQHQREKYNWHFVFVGANQDAILTGGDYGISRGTSLSFTNDTKSVQNTFHVLNKGVSCMRSSNVAYSFSDAERSFALADDEDES